LAGFEVRAMPYPGRRSGPVAGLVWRAPSRGDGGTSARNMLRDGLISLRSHDRRIDTVAAALIGAAGSPVERDLARRPVFVVQVGYRNDRGVCSIRHPLLRQCTIISSMASAAGLQTGGAALALPPLPSHSRDFRVVTTTRDLVGSVGPAHSAESPQSTQRPREWPSLISGFGPPAIHWAQAVRTGRYKASAIRQTMRPKFLEQVFARQVVRIQCIPKQ
jgi:hypothetical protein